MQLSQKKAEIISSRIKLKQKEVQNIACTPNFYKAT